VDALKLSLLREVAQVATDRVLRDPEFSADGPGDDPAVAREHVEQVPPTLAGQHLLAARFAVVVGTTCAFLHDIA
jgi:hypothetical protein